MLLEIKGKKAWLPLFIGYLLTLFFTAFSFTPLYVKDVSPLLNFRWWPRPGILYTFYIIFGYLGLSGYAFSLLFKNYGRVSGFKREQIKYVIIGTLVGLTGGATNFILWYRIPFPPLGTFLVPFYIFFLGYAIFRYRLMEIRLIIGRGAIFAFSLLIVISLGFFLIYLNNLLLVPLPPYLIIAFIIIISIAIFQFLVEFLEKKASRFLYYSFYTNQLILTQLGEQLTKVLDLEKLSSLITDTLLNTLKLDKAGILLREEAGIYRIQKIIGFHEDNGISLVRDNFLTNYLQKTKKPLIYEELDLIIRDTDDKEERKKIVALKQNMKRIEAKLCLPLLFEDKIIGIIVLGEKVSGAPYFTEDINLLTNLSRQASIALANAKLYREIKDLSEHLQDRVDQQTQKIRRAYKKLKKLDEAKSEFISIASHQLRAPLTAIKGYVSMILEGRYGKIDKTLEEKMKRVYTATERLRTLVNTLLNISRIETGKIELNLERVSLAQLVSSIIDELQFAAQNKDISLKFEKPKKKLPEILIDKEKIREAMVNVIDNAIKYTEKGGVAVELKEINSNIRVTVRDTGAGMTEKEMEDLFTSFTRGSAGNHLYTEGVGIGLYISKKFIDLHKGKIWAESEGKNKGTTFYIELPVR